MFPFSKQSPAFQAGGSSVNKSVSPIPNPNPRSFDIFGRRVGEGATSQGVAHFNAIDLGGSGDGKRITVAHFNAIDLGGNGDGKRDGVSTVMNFGQVNPAGDTPVTGVDSEIMLSLDEILDDLHKKVVSVDVNDYEVRGNSAKSIGYGSEKHTVGLAVMERNKHPEGGVASVPQKNEHHKGGSAGTAGRHEDGAAGSQGKQRKGSVPGLEATGEQVKGGIPGQQAMRQQVKDASSEIGGKHDNGEIASSQRVNQQMGEVAKVQGASDQDNPGTARLQGTKEQQNESEAAVVQGITDPSKGETSGSFKTNDQSTGEAATGSDQGKGEAVQRTGEAQSSLQAQSERALELVGGGGLEAVLSTPRKRGRQVSHRHTEIIASPDWLPEGWLTELKTRESGSSAGTKDKYFYDPVSQRRFRSRVEVFSFLETGKIGRYKSKAKSEGEVSRKRKASDGLFQNAASFDRNMRPTKIRWVLNDSEGSWIPFVNEEDLNGFNMKEAERAFDLNHNGVDACKE